MKLCQNAKARSFANKEMKDFSTYQDQNKFFLAPAYSCVHTTAIEGIARPVSLLN